MIDVESEINKYRNCKERGKLETLIHEYESLALQHANNLVLAGQYNKVAFKLKEICDKLPAPNLKNITSSAKSVSVKTASITNAEEARINAAWKQKTGKR
ncbi:MAG: hypothetical protein LBI28_03145 [Treponema sp.]|jgi:hypothetical protein|nr:hypothetical protein [Treponema sp.]